MPFRIKQGDTLPLIRAHLKDANEAPIELTSVLEVRIIVGLPGQAAKVNKSMSIVDATSGIVEYGFEPYETDEVGQYNMVFEITYNDGEILTVPTDGYESLTVIDNIFHAPIIEVVPPPLNYTTYGNGEWPYLPRVMDGSSPVVGASVSIVKDGTVTEIGPVITNAEGYAATNINEPLFYLDTGKYTVTITKDNYYSRYRFQIDSNGDETAL